MDAPTLSKTYKVLVIDDHPVFRKGIVALLGEEENLTICGEAEDAMKALGAMRKFEPDIAVVDISMPGTNGIELTKSMLSERPDLKILVLSMHDETLYALRALRAGAKAYVMKAEAMDYVSEAIKKIIAGGIYVSPRFSERLVFRAVQSMDSGLGSPVDRLSDREMEVLHLLGKGFGTREIAAELHLSIKTIETHRMHIKDKLDFKDASEMVRFAIDWVSQQEG